MPQSHWTEDDDDDDVDTNPTGSLSFPEDHNVIRPLLPLLLQQLLLSPTFFFNTFF